MGETVEHEAVRGESDHRFGADSGLPDVLAVGQLF